MRPASNEDKDQTKKNNELKKTSKYLRIHILKAVKTNNQISGNVKTNSRGLNITSQGFLINETK